MWLMIRPNADLQREVDLTERLISTIAEELWTLHGENDLLRWLEAEEALRLMVRPPK